MKKTFTIIAVAVAIFSFHAAKAQVNVSVSFGQPALEANRSFYYLPDIDCYYDVANAGYYYNSGTKWEFNRNLPGRFKGYNWQNARRVAISQPSPYLHNQEHRAQYGNFGHSYKQPRQKNDWVNGPKNNIDNHNNNNGHKKPGSKW